jgi:hypothetical protein
MEGAAGILSFLVAGLLSAQIGPTVQNQTAHAAHSASEPIYRITVVSRTTKAINYASSGESVGNWRVQRWG